MSKVRFDVAISLDGYLAGPNQSLDNPLGEGGTQVHAWAFELEAFQRAHGGTGGVVNASTPIVENRHAGGGAVIMGRHMFGGGHGPWADNPPWRGWWGDDPPYHMPVFVLTHHAREPLEMQGGTTFHFVTGGFRDALAQATRAAAGKDVLIAGGASTIQQVLAAGLVDEVNVSIAPVILGAGERLFEHLGTPPPKLEQVRVIDAPGVMHVRYRVVK
jgi:dihydrofolate reductase